MKVPSEVLNWLEVQHEKKNLTSEEKDALPVKLSIKNIDQEGGIHIKFN